LCGGAVWFLWGKKVTTLQMNVLIWEGPTARLDLKALSLILEWRPRLLSKQNRRRLRNLLIAEQYLVPLLPSCTCRSILTTFRIKLSLAVSLGS
jgi:hypothetical protein